MSIMLISNSSFIILVKLIYNSINLGLELLGSSLGGKVNILKCFYITIDNT